MRKLEHPDTFHLQAALGWLELGNHLEADQELDNITSEFRAHPDVLEVRLEIYGKARRWEVCVDVANALIKLSPDRHGGWIHRSFALHELKRTQEAYDLLLPAAEQFPKAWTIPYNLACYCAQLGRLDECKAWFTEAMAVDEQTVKVAAIDDPDLLPLWDSMSGTLWKRE